MGRRWLEIRLLSGESLVRDKAVEWGLQVTAKAVGGDSLVTGKAVEWEVASHSYSCCVGSCKSQLRLLSGKSLVTDKAVEWGVSCHSYGC